MAKTITLFFVLVIALAACSPATVTPVAQPSPNPESTIAGYPGLNTTTQDSSAYPGQVGSESGQLIVTPVPPSGAPEPEAGKASISGVLYSFTSSRALVKTSFYLSPAIGENKDTVNPALIGPRNENGDIRGVTNEQGQFEMNNIPPGNYFMVVAAPYSWSIVVQDNNNEKARLISVKEGDRLEMGVANVAWP